MSSGTWAQNLKRIYLVICLPRPRYHKALSDYDFIGFAIFRWPRGFTDNWAKFRNSAVSGGQVLSGGGGGGGGVENNTPPPPPLNNTYLSNLTTQNLSSGPVYTKTMWKRRTLRASSLNFSYSPIDAHTHLPVLYIVDSTVHSEFFFQTLILKNGFLVRLSSNFQERLFMPSSSPNFFFGGVIFKITSEFRVFSPFPWKRSIYNSFFKTLFDYNTLVSYRKLALVGILPNQLFSFSSDKDRITDSRIRRKNTAQPRLVEKELTAWWKSEKFTRSSRCGLRSSVG